MKNDRFHKCKSIDRLCARARAILPEIDFPFRERRFTWHDKFRAHGPRSWLCNVIALEQLDCTCTFVNCNCLSSHEWRWNTRSMESCRECVSRYEIRSMILDLSSCIFFADSCYLHCDRLPLGTILNDVSTRSIMRGRSRRTTRPVKRNYLPRQDNFGSRDAPVAD